MMSLSQKLNSITPARTVSELSRLLDHATVSIGEWGKRLVTVTGYKDSVEVTDVAKIFLHASTFDRSNARSIRDRLDCLALLERVKKLYLDSNKELSKTCYGAYVVPLKECWAYFNAGLFLPCHCRACSGDPMALIFGQDFDSTRRSLLLFKPEEYQALWPNVKPLGQSYTIGQKAETLMWSASKEMLEASLREKKK